MEDIKDYWMQWLWRDSTRRIITINFLVWAAIAVASLFCDTAAIIQVLALPAAFSDFVLIPWTALTYMFTQTDFLHLLVNMLWFLLFGQLIEQVLGSRTLMWLYLCGGFAAAAGFLIANGVSAGAYSIMYGASGAVAAVIGVCAVVMADWKVQLVFFGRVRVLWIALAAIFIYAFMQPTVYVAVAHASGLAAGLLYGFARRLGWLNSLTGSQFRFSGLNTRKKYKYQPPRMRSGADERLSPEQQLDALLDKVNRSGYASLSSAERQKLFDLSQRLRQ